MELSDLRVPAHIPPLELRCSTTSDTRGNNETSADANETLSSERIWKTDGAELHVATGASKPGHGPQDRAEAERATAAFRKNREIRGKFGGKQLSESSVRGMSRRREYSTGSLLHHDVTQIRFGLSQNHFNKLPKGTQPGGGETFLKNRNNQLPFFRTRGAAGKNNSGVTQCDGNNNPGRAGVKPHRPTSDRGDTRLREVVKSSQQRRWWGGGTEHSGDCWESRCAASVASCYLFGSKC